MPEFEADPGFISEDQGTIYDYEASLGEVAGASFGRQMDTNPFQFILREADFINQDLKSLTGEAERVDQQSAQEEIRKRGLDLKVPVGGITRQELNTLQYLKQREIQQNITLARRSGVGATVAGFGAGLAAGATDPLNVASAFIPVVGEARYAAWLARAESFAGRAAIRAGVGAAEGAVGAAVIEPIVYAGATSEQFDYTGADSFLNVMFGTVLGGGLHVAGGAYADWRAMPPAAAVVRQAAAEAPESVHIDATMQAVRALEDDAPVRADAVFAETAVRTQDRAAAEVDRIKAEIEAIRNDAEIDQAAALARTEALLAQAEDLHPKAVQTFTTAKGSTYQVHEDGTTTRDKMFRPEHGEKEQGMQPRSQTTFYVTAEDANKLGEFQTKGSKKSIEKHPSGMWGVKYQDGPSAGKFERRTMVTPQTSPAVGLTPVEVWRDGTRVHFGNAITKVGDGPRGLGDLIRTANQERTADTFNRQFVDDPADVEASRQGDEVVAKVKSEDLETVAVDTEFLDQQIKGLKTREMWTAADDKALEAGEAKAAELEQVASIYRAAAVCMAE